MQKSTLLLIVAVLTVGTSALKISLSKRSLIAKREAGISDADKQIILHEHNKYRSEVIPTATDMQKMYWDDNIAAVAQQWADTCVVGHDDELVRSNQVGYGIPIGQNWAGGFQTWKNAIKGWHSEVGDFIYGGGVFVKVGHYTQVVGEQAARIGCGYNACPMPTYVCNYAYGQANWKTPYKSGSECADCKTCSNKLCDCGGKICKNGGHLDVKTCKCTCPNLYGDPDCGKRLCKKTVCKNGGTIVTSDCTCHCPKHYWGTDCGTLHCPEDDPHYCGPLWPASFCTMYSNVPHDCPFMCGICGSCKGTVCKNKGRLVPSNCTCNCPKPYIDADCGRANCTAADPFYCGSDWPRDYCTMYFNVPGICPFMCRICDAKALIGGEQ